MARPAPAVCLTVDNLGEAAELGDGTWPAGAPVGRHFTVGVVERMLDLLGEHGVPATFFVEASNAEVYPDLLRAIAAHGHEVACHAWRHEVWSSLSPAEERALLERCTRALRSIGVDPVGLRPPGGLMTPATPRVLAELGYRYCSPAGTRPGVTGDVAVVPFAWRLVDAYDYAPSFAPLRARDEDAGGATGQPADALRARFLTTVRDNVARGRTTTLVFHPMFLAERAALDAFVAVLAELRALQDAGTLVCRRMESYARDLLAAPAPRPAPVVDEGTWASPTTAG
jgi:peptidoglycan/xylan/chitin deacetylase (PgdA/CDA1 family)